MKGCSLQLEKNISATIWTIARKGNRKFHFFAKGIGPKMNSIVGLVFRLTLLFSSMLATKGTSQQIFFVFVFIFIS